MKGGKGGKGHYMYFSNNVEDRPNLIIGTASAYTLFGLEVYVVDRTELIVWSTLYLVHSIFTNVLSIVSH